MEKKDNPKTPERPVNNGGTDWDQQGIWILYSEKGAGLIHLSKTQHFLIRQFSLSSLSHIAASATHFPNVLIWGDQVVLRCLAASSSLLSTGICSVAPRGQAETSRFHPLLRNQFLGGRTSSTYSTGGDFRSYSKWLLWFSFVGNLPFPVKCGFLQGCGMCPKDQEEDSMLGTKHYGS